MKALTEFELHETLTKLPNWQVIHGKLIRHFVFPGFSQAIEFVNQIADLSEEQNHHPDIDIRYNKVQLGLITHDANAITQRDAMLAAQIDRLPDGKL